MDSDQFFVELSEKLKTCSADELKKNELITDMISGSIKLLTVVESMKEVLTSKEVTTREHGVAYLSWVLEELPATLLTDREVNVILTFYLDRLKDHHNLLPAVFRGLLAIIQMEKMSKEGLLQMLTLLFQQVNCQTQQQQDRYNIYCIFKHIIENNLDDIRTMGPDFIFGCISFIEGETDPKNLLLIFDFLPLFLKKFPLGHLAEEVFEVLACYFPVDFNTAARNNVLITRNDLSEALMQCLSSTREFSDFCINLILEKLESSFKSAKLDSYSLMQKCCSIYCAHDIEKHLNHLWKVIQKDVLPGYDHDICVSGLNTLSGIVEILSQEEKHKLTLIDFLNDIVAGVKSLLNKVDDSLFQPAMNVLAAVSCRSKIASEFVIHHLKPFYDVDFTKCPSERKTILSSLLPFLTFIHKFHIAHSEVYEECSSYSLIVELYFHSISFSDHEVRALALSGIRTILPDLDDVTRNRLFQVVAQNIKNETSPDAREENLKIFKQLATDFPSEVHQIIQSHLEIDKAAISGDPQVHRILTAFSRIANLSNFTSCVISLFLNLIVNTHHYDATLECLLYASRLETESILQFKQKIHQDFRVVDKLIAWWHERTSMTGFSFNETTTLVLAEIIQSVMRDQSVDVQQITVDKYLDLLMTDVEMSNGCGDLNVHKSDATSASAKVVIILEAVLGSARQNVLVSTRSILESRLVSFALFSTDYSVRTSASRLLASLINKSEETEAKHSLEKIKEQVLKILEDQTCDLSFKSRSVELFTWIMKGLLLKGISDIETWILLWFSLLNREDVGNVVADGFQTVLAEEKLYLNFGSHCNVKILYRQRLFTYFPKLVSMYQSSSESVKMNYLVALSRLIQGVPKHIVTTEIQSAVRLLSEALDSTKPDILLSSLETTLSFLQDKEELFSGYATSLLPKFLKLALFEGCMKIRCQALKCTFYYAFYPTEILLPIKHKVISGLEPCLDDRKRLVRSEAVKARTRWFLVGAPGEGAIYS